MGLLCAVLAVVLIRHVGACAGGSDSSGYLNQARILSRGQIHAARRVLPELNAAAFSPYLYTPLGFVPNGATLTPTYPIGLPLLIAAAAAVVGWSQAPNVVIVLHALAAVVLLYALARELAVGWRGALLAGVCLAASPLFLFFSIQAMSDVPALTWTLAAGWAAWRARERTAWAAAAGICFSAAVLIRPTDVLLAPALAAAWWPLWHRRTLVGILAGLPLALGLALYNRKAYGSPWATGYGEAGSLFNWANVPATALHYLHWLPLLFTPAALLFALLPLRPSRTAWFLFLWGAVFLFFYLWYFHTHQTWWFLRFVLPAAPALILGGLWLLRPISALIPGRGRTAALAAIAIVLFDGAVASLCRLPVLEAGANERVYADSLEWMRGNVPDNAVVVCMQASGAAYYYSHYILLRWDQIERPQWNGIVRAAADARRPLYALLFRFEKPLVLDQRAPGNWRPVAGRGNVTIWQWAGATPRP
jgi:hypothetical protein